MSDEQIKAAQEREERRRRICEEAEQRVQQFSLAKQQRFERDFYAADSEARMIDNASKSWG